MGIFADSEPRVTTINKHMKTVIKIMPKVTEETVKEFVDMDAIRHDFLAINGFDIAGVDYEKDVADMSAID